MSRHRALKHLCFSQRSLSNVLPANKPNKQTKKRPWISLWYVQEKLGGDLGSTQYSTVWCLCVPSGPGSVPHPYSIFQSAFISRALYNNGCVVHSIFMHIHKCTNSITASGHSKIPPTLPLTSPGCKPLPWTWWCLEIRRNHQQDTTRIQPITFSSSVLLFFFYTNTFSTFLHMKRSAGLWQNQKKLLIG